MSTKKTTKKELDIILGTLSTAEKESIQAIEVAFSELRTAAIKGYYEQEGI